ncbi:MAG: zinc metalloprotease [Chloroflexota bacterium]
MTILRRALTLAAAASFTVMLAASTVSAGRAASVSAWRVAADACADGGIAARGGIADSSGVIRERDTGQVADPMPTSAIGAAPADLSVTVPVWFHVITDGDLGYLSLNDLRAQVRVLNTTYGGREGGADTGFSFELAGYDYTDNGKWFRMQGGGVEKAIKKALKVGGDDTLNVYTNTAGTYLGWAYLPSITDSNQAYLDGIILDWASFPHVSDQYLDRYDEGETLTHEVGHWLNLEHTFYNGCNKEGDFVEDTPAEKTPTSGCPLDKDTCPAPGLDPIHNYMDYSYDDCYTEFTVGQGQRMRDAWLLYRAS